MIDRATKAEARALARLRPDECRFAGHDPPPPLMRLPLVCGRTAKGSMVVLRCPPGRPVAVGGPFCQQHGGRIRAFTEAASDWNYTAPAIVGDSAAVLTAGQLALDHTHAYVVVREDGPGWVAWLGLGSRQIQVSREAGDSYLFGSQVEATLEATALWHERLDERYAQIKAARGGTLEWGYPVNPLRHPRVLVLQQGVNAFAAAKELPRIVGPGPSPIIRPSGEVA